MSNFIDTLLKRQAAGEQPPFDPAIEALVNDAGLVLFRIDTLGDWVYLGENWPAVAGHSVEKSLNRSHYNFIHPDDLADYRKLFRGLVCSEFNSYNHELRVICKHDQPKWFKLTACSLLDEKQNEVIAVVGILQDVHEEKTNAHRMQVRLRAFENMLDCVPGIIYRCLKNTEWTMEFVSAGCYEVTGYLPDDVIRNKNVSYASLIHPDDRQHVWNVVQSAVDEYRPFDLTYRIITSDGTEKWVWERGQGVFSSSGELLVLQGYIADITAAKAANEARNSSLLYEPVSRMPNWLLFDDRLSEAIRRRRHDPRYAFVFILLQIDKFSDIVRFYGEHVADGIVLDIQNKLHRNLEKIATISRNGDDRLGLLLESIDGFGNLNRIIQNIYELILLPVRIDEHEIYVTASLGVNSITKNYNDSNELFYDTEQALSRAHALGGARHEVFDFRHHAKTAAQYKYEQEVRKALEEQHLQVWWQPLVSLKQDILVGLEAKIVWLHPHRGNLFAEHFVPQITDTQLLMKLWEFMLSDASKQMKHWQSVTDISDLDINIYVFGDTLLAADSILRAAELIFESMPKLCSISLGMPESVFLKASNTVKELMYWLDSKQISLILDSFGEGMCSLDIIKNYPLQMVRLCPALLDPDQNDPHFVKSLVSLIHSLDIPVIADRLTSSDQLHTAKNSGIDLAQGPIVSDAIPPSRVLPLFN